MDLAIAIAPVHRDIGLVALVGQQAHLGQARPAGLILGVGEEAPAEPLPLHSGADRDVLDPEMVVMGHQLEDAHDRAVEASRTQTS